jgi:hypothetical protein
MKNMISPTLRNILILMFPFIFMIIINEFTHIQKHNHKYLKIKTINPGIKHAEHCTWACHENTDWCRKHHVKMPDNYLVITNIPYRKVIDSLKDGNNLYKGDYQINNILYLVILIPITIWFFIASGLNTHDKIVNYQNNIKS